MSVLKDLLLLGSTTFVILYIFYRWRNRKFFKLAGKLPENNKNWLLTIFSLFLSPPSKLIPKLNRLIRNDTPLTKFWLGPSLFILSKDAEFIRKVLTSPQCQIRPKHFYESVLIENALLVKNGDRYKHDRKIFNQSFSHKIISKLPKTFNEKSKDIFEKMNVRTGEINPKKLVGSFVAQSFAASQLHYEFDFDQLKVQEAYSSFSKLCTRVLQYTMCRIHPKFLKITQTGREINEFMEIFNKHNKDVIDKYIENGRNEGTSIIELLLDPKNGFTRDEIFDHITTFSIGAYDTTTAILEAALLMLGIHKDVQEKLHNEIEEIYAEHQEQDFDLNFLQKFSYLDAVVKETMRIFTAIPVVIRETSEDVEISGYLIPKGTCLFLHLYSMHRNEKYWGSDAHLFKPERFQEELKNPLAFSPFTDGNRICIGHRYGMISMKVFLINFIRTYMVHCSYKYEDVEIELNLVIDFVRENKITIQKRQEESSQYI